MPMGQKNVFKTGTDNRVISWVEGAKGMVRSPGTIYSGKWLLCQGLRTKERNSVSNAQRPVWAAMVSGQKLWTGETQLQIREATTTTLETQKQKVRIDTLASRKLDQKPSWKGDWMHRWGSASWSREQAREVNSGAKDHWMNRQEKNHLWYLNYFLCLSLSISVSIFQKISLCPWNSN